MESKYYTWSKNKMKMIINSDFKEFNKQTNCISRANIIANTIYGNYIRPYNQTYYEGRTYEKGKLFNYDLQFFNIGKDMREYLKTFNKMVALYEIFIYRKGRKDIIGWLIESDNRIVNITYNYCLNVNYNKRISVLELVKDILEEN